MATWDLTDIQGRRAEPGIYLVFMVADDEERTAEVCKFAIID